MTPLVVTEFAEIHKEQLGDKSFEKLGCLADALSTLRDEEDRPPLAWARRCGDAFIKTQQYVGVLALHGGQQIEILPKIARVSEKAEVRSIFLNMLRCLKDFPHRKLPEAKQQAVRMPIFEVFIAAFIDAVEALVRQGLKSDYVRVEKNSFFFKGRLMVSQHLRYNAAHGERFYVAYDEYLHDRPENRLIKTTIRRLQGLTGLAANARRLRSLTDVFDEVSESLHPERDFAAVSRDRGMVHYRPVLAWCKLFLRGKSLSSTSGRCEAVSLLFPMHELFEAYVACKIRERVGSRLTVSVQDAAYHLFGADGDFALRPDIVLYSGEGKPVLILDTKWKLLSDKAHNGISQADMYQMYAYSRRYAHETGADTPPPVMLLYPWVPEPEHLRRYVYRESADSGAMVMVHQMDLRTPAKSVAVIEKVLTLLADGARCGEIGALLRQASSEGMC